MKSLLAPKIETLSSPPVVGKTYRVPSVRRGDVFAPVFGPPHTDVELGQPVLHFHVDIRFLTDDAAKEVGVDVIACRIPDTCAVPIKFTIPVIAGQIDEDVDVRPMTCLRKSPDYQSPRVVREPGVTHYTYLNVGSAAQTGLIEDQCENERVTKCGKCPHRGTPLGHQPVVDGVVVCPAHLLKWDKTTGRMIRKTKKIADGQYIQI